MYFIAVCMASIWALIISFSSFGAYFSAAIAVLMLLGGAVLRSLTKPADVRGPRKKQRA